MHALTAADKEDDGHPKKERPCLPLALAGQDARADGCGQQPGRRMEGPDLSRLSDPVLVHLFRMLPWSDRASLARCCRNLSTFMDRASVWGEVTITMGMDILPVFDRPGRVDFTVVDCLRATNLAMIRKYSRHFRNVTVVMNSGCLAKASLAVLADLCQRGVVQAVILRLDRFVSKAKEYTLENSLSGNFMRPRSKMKARIPAEVFLPMAGRTAAAYGWSAVGDLIQVLSPHTGIFIRLPVSESERMFVELEEGHGAYGELYESLEVLKFYGMSKTKKLCSQLKGLTLVSDDQRHEDYVAQKSLPSSLQLISSFPSLQELHLNMVSLSDDLLRKLSKVPGKRGSLCRLVISHISGPFSLQARYGSRGSKPFQHLSSDAWGQLAKACPSLKVEVVAHNVYRLENTIKPETPLVKLDIHSCDIAMELKLCQLLESHRSTLQDLSLTIRNFLGEMCSRCTQQHLVKMVLTCRKLRHLRLDMRVNCRTLLRLARVPRHWVTFAYRPDKVFWRWKEGDTLDNGDLSKYRLPKITSAILQAKIREALGFSATLI